MKNQTRSKDIYLQIENFVWFAYFSDNNVINIKPMIIKGRCKTFDLKQDDPWTISE